MIRLLCLVSCLVATAWAEVGLPFAHEYSDLKPDSAVRFGRLANGVRYAVLSNPEPKNRAALRFGVLTGSFNETEDQRGLAHFLEHMAFNGSTRFPAGTLIEYFQRLGMSFGSDTNAFTSFDRTVYLLELPDTAPDTLEKAFTLFADYGGGLLLDETEIDKERGIILSEERARDSVGLRALVAEFAFLLPESIIARRLPIGSKEVIAQAPRERFVDYYDTWYRPENFVVVAVGDFDAMAVEAQLTKALSSLQPRAPARPPANLGTIQPAKGVVAKLHHDPDAPAVNVMIEAVIPHDYEPDTAAIRLKRIPRVLALSMINRRLSILAKQEGAPFTGGSAHVAEQFDFFRAPSIELTCQPAQWREALGVAEQELRRALTHGFQEPELREAVAGFRNNLEQAVSTAASRQSRDLASQLVASVIDRNVFTPPEGELALLGPALEQATVEDCAAALRAVWAEAEGRHLFVAGNLTLAESEKEIIAAYEASRGLAVAAPEPINEVQFAYTDFGPSGKIATREDMTDLGATLLQFENGVRLNLKPTDFEAGRIRVSIRVGGGRLTEPKDQPGLARTAASIFIPGGLGKHAVDDINRLFAGKTVNVSFGVDDDAFILAGTTNRTDLALQLQLLCAFLTDPGYRPEALRQFRKGMEQTYTRLAHTVEGPLSAEVPALMAGGDPRFGLPDKEVLFSRTSEEVRTWLAAPLSDGPVEIALVGDLDPEATVDAVARTFGTLPARLAKPGYADERRVTFPEPMEKAFSVPTEIDRGIVQVLWPATDRREVRLARRLNLLAEVFQDRLRLKLREQMGGTYSPNVAASLSDTFIGHGFIVAQATVAPNRAEEVAAAIKAVAASLSADGVSEDELQRAKQPLLVGLRTSERQNPYWLGNVLGAAQEQPQRLDWASDRYADNEAITKDDLNTLARRFLNPHRASQFISLPRRDASRAQPRSAKRRSANPRPWRRKRCLSFGLSVSVSVVCVSRCRVLSPGSGFYLSSAHYAKISHI